MKQTFMNESNAAPNAQGFCIITFTPNYNWDTPGQFGLTSFNAARIKGPGLETGVGGDREGLPNDSPISVPSDVE